MSSSPLLSSDISSLSLEGSRPWELILFAFSKSWFFSTEIFAIPFEFEAWEFLCKFLSSRPPPMYSWASFFELTYDFTVF